MALSHIFGDHTCLKCKNKITLGNFTFFGNLCKKCKKEQKYAQIVYDQEMNM